jgi:shikimate kinase
MVVRNMATRHHLFITLSGMMGSGKSTVGDELARLLSAQVCDLDEEIPRHSGGRSIPELFSDGETVFREAERATIAALIALPLPQPGHRVLALGGGALTHPATRALAFSSGPSVYLRCSLPVLIERLSPPEQRAKRPLLAGEDWRDQLQALLEARREVYEQCDIIVDADGPAPDVAQEIFEALRDRYDAADLHR